MNSHSFAKTTLSTLGSQEYSLTSPFQKSHVVFINSEPEVAVELVASINNQYLASSGVNLSSFSFLSDIEFTFIITDATFSFIITSALEEKGNTSVYHFTFLWSDVTSKKIEKFHSSLNK
ncbi:hypothetical protein HOF65_08755 [bacterium]|nr:hypothetical protein [bacterium]MBT3853963.1 hypothetical protein [bacterium]MBT5492009.1 hypothetical protein [bacterium]